MNSHHMYHINHSGPTDRLIQIITELSTRNPAQILRGFYQSYQQRMFAKSNGAGKAYLNRLREVPEESSHILLGCFHARLLNVPFIEFLSQHSLSVRVRRLIDSRT